MPDAIDTTNGISSFASARIPAWHRLGVVLPDLMTAEQAMEYAHLGGWNVRKSPATTTVMDETGVTTLEMVGRYATIRTNPITGRPQYLGDVGQGYTPVQNEELASFINAVAGESGAAIETAGALDDGQQVFITMKLPEAMVLTTPDGQRDATDMYLAILNSHHGQSSMRCLVTPIRIVCRNTQTLALAQAASSFSIRHTSGALAAVAEARRSLGLTFRYTRELADEMQALMEKDFETEQARAIFEQLFKVDEPDKLTLREANGRMAHVDECMKLLDAPTNAMIKGTAYAALNAVTEHVDWTWAVKGKNVDQDQARAMRVIVPQFTKLKTQAFQLLSVA